MNLNRPYFPLLQMWIVSLLVPAFASRFWHLQPALVGRDPSAVSGCSPGVHGSAREPVADLLENQPRSSTFPHCRHLRGSGPARVRLWGIPEGAGAGRACARHTPGPGRVTDSSSPRRKWATARREEPAVAWRLRASGSWSERLAPSSPCHGKKGYHRGAAAPGVHDSVALAAPLRDGLRVQVGDGPLGCEVARDSAAAGGQVGAGRTLCGAPRGGRARRGWGRAETLTAPPTPSLHRCSRCPRAWLSEHHLLPFYPVRSTHLQIPFSAQFVFCVARGF